MNPLITPQQADALLGDALPALGTEHIPLGEAIGRVLAEPLLADRPLPPFDRIMMDGITFPMGVATRTSGSLELAGFHPAGAPAPGALAPGTCWETGTGAVLPPDCDTVVPVELIRREGRTVTFDPAECEVGRHIHPLGSDYCAGAELVPSGRTLGARECSVAASVGAAKVKVNALPRIAIFTTGDEIVPFASTPESHQIRQSNGPALTAALAALGIPTVRHQHLPDDETLQKNALGEALAHSDLILCCGGISKGKHDHVRAAVTSHLGDPAFHGIAQRPGKPLAFWAGPPPVFALPGNPMSVLVCFHRYVVPFLHALSGGGSPPLQARLAEDVSFPPPLAFFLPVSLDRQQQAQPRPLSNSGDFATAISSTGFLELPAGQDHFAAGFEANYHPWL